MRLQLLIAKNTGMSRRAADEAIALGRVRVNGKTAEPGVQASAQDKILIDGKPLIVRNQTPSSRVLAYHKPLGEECSRAAEHSVFDNLPEAEQRWLSVGRLDMNTSGLLLFTQDGKLAHRLTHPSYAIDREYAVRVHGKVDDAMLERLRRGVSLEDGDACFLDLVDCGAGNKDSSNRWFYAVVQQGRNRLVRRLWESQGVQVSRLIRVRFAVVMLAPSLKPGQYSELSSEEVNDLYACVRCEPPATATTARRSRQTNRSANRRGRAIPLLLAGADQPTREDRDRDRVLSLSRPPRGERGQSRRKTQRNHAGKPHQGSRSTARLQPQRQHRKRPLRDTQPDGRSPRSSSTQSARTQATARTGSGRATGTGRRNPRSQPPRQRSTR